MEWRIEFKKLAKKRIRLKTKNQKTWIGSNINEKLGQNLIKIFSFSKEIQNLNFKKIINTKDLSPKTHPRRAYGIYYE